MADPVVSIDVQLDIKNAQKQVEKLKKELASGNINITGKVDPALKRGLQNAEKGMGRTKKEARELGGAFEVLGAKTAESAKRLQAYAFASTAIFTVGRAFSSSVRHAVRFEKELIKISQITGKTVSGLKSLTDEVTKLSTGLGVSSLTLIETSRILAQTGLRAKDVQKTLEALAKTQLAPTFDNLNNTVETTIAVMRQFGIGADQIEKKLGSINAVAANFAVEAKDIGIAIRRAGGAFRNAGGTVEELISLFTSVRGTTRETAETIATGFRTIFTRIQRPETIKFLRQFGVELQNLEGQFIGPFQAVGELNRALRNLDPKDVRYSQIVEQLGGFRQVSKVIPLVKEFDTAQRALSVAQKGGTSLTRDAETAQKALAVQLVRIREEYTKFARALLDNSGMRAIITLALNAAEAFGKLLNQIEPIVPLILMIGGIRVGQLAGRGIRSQIGKSFRTGVDGKNSGGIVGYNAGGFTGKVPGVGNKDSVLLDVEQGSFVLRKSIASKVGHQKLSKLNSIGGSSGPSGAKERIAATPGEYIFGPRTVSAAGPGFFQKMNQGKIKGYASGGIIGRIGGGIGAMLSSISRMGGDASKTEGLGVTDAVERINKALKSMEIALGSTNKALKEAAAAKRKATEAEEIQIRNEQQEHENRVAAERAFQKRQTGKHRDPKTGLYMAKPKRTDPGWRQRLSGQRRVDGVFQSLTPSTGLTEEQRLEFLQTGNRSTVSRRRDRVRSGAPDASVFEDSREILAAREKGLASRNALNESMARSREAMPDATKWDGINKGLGNLAGGTGIAVAAVSTFAGQVLGAETVLGKLSYWVAGVVTKLILMSKAMDAFMASGILSGASGMMSRRITRERFAPAPITSGIPKLGGNEYYGPAFGPMKNTALNRGLKGTAGWLDKTSGRLQKFGMAALAAGLIMNEVGNALKDWGVSLAKAAGERGEEGSFGAKAAAGAGGALKFGGMAGIAAFMLSITGVGLALVVAAGAIWGLVGGVTAADKAFKQAKFDKSMDAFSKALERGGKDASEALSAAGGISVGVSALRRRKGEVAGDEEGMQNFRAEIDKSRVAFKSYLLNVAKSSNTFQELENVVGAGLINEFTALSEQSLFELRREIEKQIEVTKKETEERKRSIAAAAASIAIFNAAQNISAAFTESEMALDNFSNAIAASSASLDNSIGAAKFQQVGRNLNRPKELINFEIFNKEIEQVSKTFKGEAGRLIDPAKMTGEVLNKLSKTIESSRLEQVQTRSALQNIVKRRIREQVEEIKTQQMLNAKGKENQEQLQREIELGARRLGERLEAAADGIKEEDIGDLKSVIGKLSSAVEDDFKPFISSASFINKATEGLQNAIKTRTEAELQLMEARMNEEKRALDEMIKIRQAAGGVGQTEGEVQESFRRQQNTRVFGPVGAFVRNFTGWSVEAEQVGKSLSKVSKDLKDVRRKIVDDQEMGLPERQQLIENEAALSKQAINLTKALEAFKDTTLRTTPILEKLSKLRADREKRTNLAVEFGFSGNEQREQIKRQAILAKRLQNAGKNIGSALNAFSDEDRGLANQFLSRFSDAEMFGPLTDMEKRLRKSRGEDVKPGDQATGREIQLRAALPALVAEAQKQGIAIDEAKLADSLLTPSQVEKQQLEKLKLIAKEASVAAGYLGAIATGKVLDLSSEIEKLKTDLPRVLEAALKQAFVQQDKDRIKTINVDKQLLLVNKAVKEQIKSLVKSDLGGEVRVKDAGDINRIGSVFKGMDEAISAGRTSRLRTRLKGEEDLRRGKFFETMDRDDRKTTSFLGSYTTVITKEAKKAINELIQQESGKDARSEMKTFRGVTTAGGVDTQTSREVLTTDARTGRGLRRRLQKKQEDLLFKRAEQRIFKNIEGVSDIESARKRIKVLGDELSQETKDPRRRGQLVAAQANLKGIVNVLEKQRGLITDAVSAALEKAFVSAASGQDEGRIDIGQLIRSFNIELPKALKTNNLDKYNDAISKGREKLEQLGVKVDGMTDKQISALMTKFNQLAYIIPSLQGTYNSEADQRGLNIKAINAEIRARQGHIELLEKQIKDLRGGGSEGGDADRSKSVWGTIKDTIGNLYKKATSGNSLHTHDHTAEEKLNNLNEKSDTGNSILSEILSQITKLTNTLTTRGSGFVHDVHVEGVANKQLAMAGETLKHAALGRKLYEKDRVQTRRKEFGVHRPPLLNANPALERMAIQEGKRDEQRTRIWSGLTGKSRQRVFNRGPRGRGRLNVNKLRWGRGKDEFGKPLGPSNAYLDWQTEQRDAREKKREQQAMRSAAPARRAKERRAREKRINDFFSKPWRSNIGVGTDPHEIRSWEQSPSGASGAGRGEKVPTFGRGATRWSNGDLIRRPVPFNPSQANQEQQDWLRKMRCGVRSQNPIENYRPNQFNQMPGRPAPTGLMEGGVDWDDIKEKFIKIGESFGAPVTDVISQFETMTQRFSDAAQGGIQVQMSANVANTHDVMVDGTGVASVGNNIAQSFQGVLIDGINTHVAKPLGLPPIPKSVIEPGQDTQNQQFPMT